MSIRTSHANQVRSLRAIFAIGVVVLVLSVATTYFIGLAAIQANSAIIQSQSVIDHVETAVSTLKDAETGQRGFLLTGEANYLEPYDAAKLRIINELRIIDGLTTGNGLPRDEVSGFHHLADDKLAELDRTVTLRRQQGFDPALAEVRSGVGKRLMDRIRGMADLMVDREMVNQKAQYRLAERLSQYRTLLFALTALINLGYLRWAYRRIRREIVQRENAALDVQRQKDLLTVTLASIGDGVIVTDNQGRISFLNEVAQQLTGWPPDEARGQPCATVFNIINEQSRKLVESPVDKVLRLGAIVGLANHTLLIRRDGVETPIDDSGAPIREADGTIRGVVLVFRDFSKHKAAQAELRSAKEEAEAANIAKDNFLATLSHELRTPLTPVAATLADLEESPGTPPVLLDDIRMMRRNVDLEARLIDDLLDLTRIVRGKLSLNPEVADVHDLIQAVAGMYQSEIHAKRLRLSVHLGADRHFVYADPARLQQVFWNILKNATKFTPEGGAIEVHTGTDPGGRVEVSIRDSGIGMSREVLERLFVPFEQGTAETVRRYGGLGLGMAISKALMDAQGGTIRAQSPGASQGSTFTVALPWVEKPDGSDTPAVAAQPAQPRRALNILIVEDHPDTARVMSRLLGNLGHHVTIANSVASGLDAVAANPFDLLLSDIGLPDGTGMDLIRQVRKTSSLPAIALTGFGMEEDVAKCREAGFNHHLTKPVNFQRLESIIDNAAGDGARPGA